ncbi:uncharacterized protein C6orf203 homolog [Harpegnathos saltator]|uniref:uncharacterized protein C6orf203 homolog n=1 Tax=Harpegnathos saltator TaxID=610380 RepID=UPI000590030B|nr:uncharacterized protein C6orf203 homolog [Harpegnathos saltator]
MLFKVTFNIIRRSLTSNIRMLHYLQSNLSYNNNAKQHCAQDHCNLYVTKRFKSSKKKKAEQMKQMQQDEGFSDDEESVIEEEAPAGSKVVTINIQSLRLDTISKVGFGISRSKIDEAFYASKLRLNGQKVLKKSKELDTGDEVDMILHRNLDNFLVIHRIVILSITPGSNNMKIKLSRDRNLLIEDYAEPWSSE